jgi:serine/threonine protein kinase
LNGILTPILVSDAGLTKFYGVLQTPYGTPAFTDPDVLAGTKILGKESDIYSFGMSMYEIWVSLDPWKNLDDSQIVTEVVKKVSRGRARRKGGEGEEEG